MISKDTVEAVRRVDQTESIDLVYDVALDSIDFGWNARTQARIKNGLYIKGILTIRDLVSLDRELFMAFDHMEERDKALVEYYLLFRELSFANANVRPVKMNFETWFSTIDSSILSPRDLARLAFDAGKLSASTNKE